MRIHKKGYFLHAKDRERMVILLNLVERKEYKSCVQSQVQGRKEENFNAKANGAYERINSMKHK